MNFKTLKAEAEKKIKKFNKDVEKYDKEWMWETSKEYKDKIKIEEIKINTIEICEKMVRDAIDEIFCLSFCGNNCEKSGGIHMCDNILNIQLKQNLFGDAE